MQLHSNTFKYYLCTFPVFPPVAFPPFCIYSLMKLSLCIDFPLGFVFLFATLLPKTGSYAPPETNDPQTMAKISSPNHNIIDGC